MLQTFKYRLLNGWNVMRLIRLAFSVFIMIQAVQVSEPVLAALGGIFLFQAAFNYGCCAAGACNTGTPVKKKDNIEEIEYTEIK